MREKSLATKGSAQATAATNGARGLGTVGLRLCLIWAATAVGLPAQTTGAAQTYTYTLLHTFTGPDGAYPAAGVARDASGNLYGTTFVGGNGTTSCLPPLPGCGVVFKIDPSGQETVLHSFTDGSDGGFPEGDGTLLLDGSGNLYGTTELGGSDACPMGCGVVFKVSPAGEETVLHTFTGTDANPMAGLVRDTAGRFFGLTAAGYGTAFAITRTGKFKQIDVFPNGEDPMGSLLATSNDNFYGTTFGGAYPYPDGWLFELNPSSKGRVVYVFCSETNCTDGAGPTGNLVQDAEGNLYGTTYGGGNATSSCFPDFPGCGVVFKIDPSGQETVLYNFTGGSDGGTPTGGLVIDAAGNLYGTTYTGGSFAGNCAPSLLDGCGVVFELSPSGTETVLYTFTGEADGAIPLDIVLLRDHAGNLYGTAGFAGSYAGSCASYGCGVVFKLTRQQ